MSTFKKIKRFKITYWFRGKNFEMMLEAYTSVDAIKMLYQRVPYRNIEKLNMYMIKA